MRTVAVLAISGLALLFAGCEQVFTTNVFSELKRDPSNLPKEQQIAYAESALSSGNQEEMAKAYDSLAKTLEDNDDPELNKLAADLAVGASGMNDVLSDLTSAATDGNLSDLDSLGSEVNDKLDDVDYSYIDEAEEQIDAAEANGGTASEEQYLTVAAGMAMKAGQDAGGVEMVSAEDATEVTDFVNDAIEKTGTTEGPLKDLADALNGLS
jgi:hypothetical protein